MNRNEYHAECLSQSIADAGLDGTIPLDKIGEIAESFVMGLNMESEAFGDLSIPNPMRQEIDELKARLKKEREKVLCRTCNASGIITSYGPSHSATSQCQKCNGEGRHDL